MSKEAPKPEPIHTTYSVIRAGDDGAYQILEVQTQGKKVLSSDFHQPSDVLYIIMSKVERLIEQQAKR